MVGNFGWLFCFDPPVAMDWFCGKKLNMCSISFYILSYNGNWAFHLVSEVNAWAALQTFENPFLPLRLIEMLLCIQNSDPPALNAAPILAQNSYCSARLIFQTHNRVPWICKDSRALLLFLYPPRLLRKRCWTQSNRTWRKEHCATWLMSFHTRATYGTTGRSHR